MDTRQILNNWSKPKSLKSEKVLISARLEFPTYARLHALKAAFPSYSINKFINDILENGLDSLIVDLGKPDTGGDPVYRGDCEVLREGEEDSVIGETGANSAHLFNVAFNDIMKNGKASEILKASKKSEEES